MHSIRLREPWECVPGEQSTQFRRRFGKPTGLETGDRVELVIEESAGDGKVSLNGALLHAGSIVALRCDITEQLLPRNELVIESASSQPPSSVRLEIYEPRTQ